MNILKWAHPDISQNQNTSLTSQANATDTTLNVINTKGFAVSKILLIGNFGSEDSEIVKTHAATAPTDTVITLAAALKYSHSSDTPITLLDFDQIEIYRASSLGGSYSLLATVDITPDEDGTTYRDASGAITDYYKIRYKNTIETSYSGYSAEVPATGFADETLAGMIQAVYTQFSRQSKKLLNRADIIRWLNEGYLQLASKIIDLGVDFYVKYGTDGNGAKISFVAGTRAFALPSDFVRPIRWDFTYDNVSYYPADPMDPAFDHPQATYSKTSPKYYYEALKIVPRPTPTESAGGMRPRYIYMPAKMSKDDDTPELPLGYQTLPVTYALQKAFESDRKGDEATYYATDFSTRTDLMLTEVRTRYPELPQSIPMFGVSLDSDDNDSFNVPR